MSRGWGHYLLATYETPAEKRSIEVGRENPPRSCWEQGCLTLESPSPASPAAHTRRRVLRPRIYVPLLLVGAVACATVPITGRSQLILISEQAALAAADEHFAGAELANAQRKGLIVTATDSPAAAQVMARVQRVSDRIIDAAGMRSARQWEVFVVRSRSRNASVAYNGKIVVLTPLLEITQDDAGLAAVHRP